MAGRSKPLVMLLLVLLIQLLSTSVSIANPVSAYRPTAHTHEIATVCRDCSNGDHARAERMVWENSTKGHTEHTYPIALDLNIGRYYNSMPTFTARKDSGHKHCHDAIKQRPRNCSYIRDKCAGYGDGIFNYVELYYCGYQNWHASILVIILVWLALLFIWLGVSASEYFSPNINAVAKLLHFPESLAGVTLLAFGNGAPDLFSTFSAVRAGSGALAIGQLVGSASFIIGVVLGATTFVTPVYRVSSIPYLREACFFTVTIGMVAVIVFFEKLTQSMAAGMVGLYVMYVVAVVFTTYYEERCQLTQLEARIEDATVSSCPIAPESVSEANILTGPQPLQKYVAENNTRSHAGSPWNKSTASLSSRGRQKLWNQRRKTTSATYTDLGCKDMWALGTLKGSASVRALGEFLGQHRKSLLAAAEYRDMLGEARCADNPGSRARPSEGLDEFTSLRNEQTSHGPTYGSMDVAVPTKNINTDSEDEQLLMHKNSVWPPRPLGSSLPATWNDYTMGCTSSRLDNPNSIDLGSMSSSQMIPPENSVQCSESDAEPSRYLHIFSLDGPTAASAEGPQVYSRNKNKTPPELLVDLNNRKPKGSVGSHCDIRSVSDHRTDEAPSPYTEDLSSAVAYRAMPSTPQSLHAALASTNGDAPQSIWPPPSVSSSIANTGQLSSRGAAIARACIPTLHYWHPGTSVRLKLFIAFSAIPVFLLTLTVPVILSISDDDNRDGENNNTPSSVCNLSQENADHGLIAYENTQSNTDTLGICIQQEHRSDRIHSYTSSRTPPRLSDRRTSTTPLLIYEASTPEAVGEQNQNSITKWTPASSPSYSIKDGSNSAYSVWAEKVASYLRSIVSVVFLCHALYYSGYIMPGIDEQTKNTLSIGLAAISMLGNYIARRSSFRIYWLQVALPCFAGFACGLVWVSIIADEIVSITQALGLMLGLSEEILGLTIVGFGNSLGDLVTNLTLTRMGYPMMAVSACFGGPMLYILLGVGVAACGMMAGSGSLGDTYWIPITSPTVLVSTVCLLINTALFLIAVPLQRFQITRTVGAVALCIYVAGMALNVYLEV